MTGNKKLHFQALIRTGYVKKGGTAYVKRNFNHPIYRSGLYEPDLYSHDFCPVCEIPSEKAMDQKAQEHLPALSGTDQLIPATDFSVRSSSLHRLIIHVSQTAAYSRSSEQFSIPASEKWGFVPFSPNLGSVSACVLWEFITCLLTI